MAFALPEKIISPSLNSYTNSSVLFKSMGSFWTQIFNEKETVRGYTLSQAEELIQSYYNLVEVVNSYSVKDIPIYHKERWIPFKILRSEYNNIPFNFQSPDDSDVAEFGIQSYDDLFSPGLEFKFGKPKPPVAEVFAVIAPQNLKKCPIVTNRIIKPSFALSENNGIKLVNNIIYFNFDIFSLKDLAVYDVLNDDGSQLYFIDKNGIRQKEQQAILWIYNGELDWDNLFYSFGYIFDLKLDTSEAYKELLKSVVNLFVSGPTVYSIKSIACAFTGVSPIVENEEIIEDIFSDGELQYIVTDRNVYSFDLFYELNTNISIGNKVYGGEIIVNAVEYYDQLVTRNWWTSTFNKTNNKDITSLKYPLLSIPPQLFLGNYEYSLIFVNDFKLATIDSSGKIFFPVSGSINDVTTFQNYINKNSDELAELLGLSYPDVTEVSINPLDFIFTNFFKTNTALIKLNFKSVAQAITLLNIFDVFKESLPAHVYLLFFFEFNFNNENWDGWNTITADGEHTDVDGNVVSDGEYLKSMDGSDSYGRVLNVASKSNPISNQVFSSRSIDAYSNQFVDDTEFVLTNLNYQENGIIASTFYTRYEDGGVPNQQNFMLLDGLLNTSSLLTPIVVSGDIKIDPDSDEPKKVLIRNADFNDYVKPGYSIIFLNSRMKISYVDTSGEFLILENIPNVTTLPGDEGYSSEWTISKNLTTKEVGILSLMSFDP